MRQCKIVQLISHDGWNVLKDPNFIGAVCTHYTLNLADATKAQEPRIQLGLNP